MYVDNSDRNNNMNMIRVFDADDELKYDCGDIKRIL